jgi:hypothetical protein
LGHGLRGYEIGVGDCYELDFWAVLKSLKVGLRDGACAY